MRDKKKSNNYFNKYINEQYGGIELFKLSFDKGGEGALSKEKAAKAILMYYSDLLCAKYSSNADKNDMKRLVTEMLPYLQYNKFTNAYVESLWILSVSYVLEIEPEKLEILKERIIENRYDDYLISRLLDAIFGTTSSNYNFNWDKPYAKLKPVLEDKEETDINTLLTYLTKDWYHGHNDCAWYETHKKDNLAYAGYWSFETAALVKLYNLDDTILQGVDYYPYDLVHFDNYLT